MKVYLDDIKRHFQELWPDIPFEQPSGKEVEGEIRIGIVKSTNGSFGLNLDELNEHLLITGRSGSGKTTINYHIMLQLLQRGIPFLAFDFKQDYRHLLGFRK